MIRAASWLRHNEFILWPDCGKNVKTMQENANVVGRRINPHATWYFPCYGRDLKPYDETIGTTYATAIENTPRR